MGMEELAMMMDLAHEVGVLLAGGLEHHLSTDQYFPAILFFQIITLEPLVSLCDAR
jgi:hypothetical protein